ncbi:MAG: hypothetical protein V1835_07015 [Candidatus Micrarchaeota archaeon]
MADNIKLRGSSLIVQFMALLEEVTPIKPVKGRSGIEVTSYEDGMGGRASMMGLNQQQVYTLLAIGLAYALILVVTGQA